MALTNSITLCIFGLNQDFFKVMWCHRFAQLDLISSHLTRKALDWTMTCKEFFEDVSFSFTYCTGKKPRKQHENDRPEGASLNKVLSSWMDTIMTIWFMAYLNISTSIFCLLCLKSSVAAMFLAFSKSNWKFHHQSTSFKEYVTQYDIKKVFLCSVLIMITEKKRLKA